MRPVTRSGAAAARSFRSRRARARDRVAHGGRISSSSGASGGERRTRFRERVDVAASLGEHVREIVARRRVLRRGREQLPI